MIKHLFIAALALLAVPAMAAEKITGKAEVIDGATLKIAGRAVKLAGVLAPPVDLVCHTKRGRPYDCGRLAPKALFDMVRGQEIACTLEGTGAAHCMAGFLSVNENLVMSGRVMAAPDAGARIMRAAKAAKHLNEGLWKGKFPPPETWHKPQ